ncbi:ABC-F family ATP-binding cassette domain-containing protein [Candidatus Bipolaricaulota bacterium]|nr:ABC-F family ATP-binding cassette domain-containing protein [Candidatus Bipolaricaulota bacterium]
MSILQIEQLSKSFAADILFDPFSAQVSPGDRVALIGDNGVGKSTLLRIIAGAEPPSEGAVRLIGDVRTGYLPQTVRLEGEGTLRQAMDAPFAHLHGMERELRSLEHAIAAGTHDSESNHRYDDLLHSYERLGGYEIDARIRSALIGVGFTADQFDTPVRVLSGGEEARAALARVLLGTPDLLMLDEPTNHLDFSALDWLEEVLLQFSGALILVSHDRHLLDRVANRTWDMAFGEVTAYAGGYTKSRAQRDADRTRRLSAYEDQEETIEKYKDFVRRHKAGQKVRQAKDRERKLERIEKTRIERPKDAKRISLQIKMSTAPGKKVFSARNLAIGFDQPLFTVPEADVYREEKVAIIGPNGCGKTTLLRTIIGEHPPLSGTCELGHNVRHATFSQRQEGLHGRDTVMDAVLSRASLTISEARGLLGRFLFSGDEVEKKMDALSGGERSRVALALLSLIDGNLLLLDEPTNHLDLASQEILERAVQDYPGTVLLVSHDRALLEAVTTQVWLIEDGQVHVHDYGYIEFRRRRNEAMSLGKKPPIESTPSSKPAASKPKPSSASSREIEARRQALESEIEFLEQQIQDLEQALVTASEAGDVTRISDLSTEYKQAQDALTQKYDTWNAFSEA